MAINVKRLVKSFSRDKRAYESEFVCASCGLKFKKRDDMIDHYNSCHDNDGYWNRRTTY